MSPSMSDPRVKVKPLRKPSLLDGAINAIQKAILQGGFRPGDLLPSEGELADRLGISRTIVREAMRVLEARGLVETGQGRRARFRSGDPKAVSAPLHILISGSEHALLDLLEVRRGIEVEMAALAAKRASDAQVLALGKTMDEMRQAGSDLDELIEADFRFHTRLADCTGNVVFHALLEPLADLLRASRQRSLKSAGAAVSVSCHQAIHDAVARHDEDAARRAMIDHLDITLRHLGEKPRP